MYVQGNVVILVLDFFDSIHDMGDGAGDDCMVQCGDAQNQQNRNQRKGQDHQHQQALHLVNIIVGYGTQKVPAIVHDFIATKQHLPNAVHRYGDTALGIR